MIAARSARSRDQTEWGELSDRPAPLDLVVPVATPDRIVLDGRVGPDDWGDRPGPDASDPSAGHPAAVRRRVARARLVGRARWVGQVGQVDRGEPDGPIDRISPADLILTVDQVGPGRRIGRGAKVGWNAMVRAWACVKILRDADAHQGV